MMGIPFVFLFLFAFLAFSNKMFDISTENNEDNLLLSDPILIASNIIKAAPTYLGSEAVNKAQLEKLKDQVRHKIIPMMGTTFILY